MNKKIVTIMLTLTLCASMLPTTVEAKLFDIMRPGEEKTTTNKGDAINIIKHLGVQLDSKPGGGTSVGEGVSIDGDATQGSQGRSIAFAYLTPQKEFGLVNRTNINLGEESGTNKSVSDPLGVWKTIKSGDALTTFYNNAVSDFKSSGISSKIDISIEDITNGSVTTQKSDLGTEFVAATLYVRWFYDTLSGRHSDNNLYRRQLPILETYSGTSGPYVAWGDFFTTQMRVIPGASTSQANIDENKKRRQNIVNNADKYIRSLKSVSNSKTVLTGTYLTEDPYYGRSVTSSKNEPNNKACYEKLFEYRKYFNRGNDGSDGSSGSDYYEIVYPVETYTTITNESDATIGILASVESNTVFKDSNKEEVDRYEFKVKIEPFEPVTENVNTLESPKTYSILHDKNSAEIPSSPSGEPPENKADVWHEIISRELVVKDKDGKNVIDPIKLTSNNETVTIYPEDVDYKSLGGYTVCVEITYKTLSRYMQHKEMYTYSYHWYDGKDKTTIYEYSKIYSILSNTSQVIQSGLSQIKDYHDKTEPKSIYVYETVGGDGEPQTTTVYDTILGPNGSDPVSPTLSVDVNPPNALTVLEGGIFDINLTFDPKDISIGQETDETRVWIEDLKITPVIVTAQNGDVIYEHTTPIDSFTNEELSASIIGVTAKPTHIGKATVTVYYEYTLVEEVYNRDKIVDEVGNVTEGEEYLVRTDKTECKGKATGYFNIYSLTGVTSQK